MTERGIVDITVSSRHVEVSPSLRATTIEKIGRLERFDGGIDRAEVRFQEERNPRIANKEVCEVTLHGNGHIVRAKVAAPDQFAAVDLAIEKLEHQLEKLKKRTVARNHGKAHATPAKGAVAVAIAETEPVEGRLVRTKRFHMKPMSTDEAILQMDLLGHEFFLFEHADTGQAAVVYRRADGDVGLIEGER
jgi:putative sigma-54 modulation protein